MDDLDVIGLARGPGSSLVVILFIREGYLSGSCHYPVKDEGGEPGEIIAAFLTHYYSRAAFIPAQVLISDPLEEPEALVEWLTDQKSKKVVLIHPQRGQQAALIKMAKANAENQLQARQSLQMDELLKKVQKALQLKKLPRWIEAIDISNLSGELAVGAIVAYRDGRPAKEDFRNYKIQQVTGIDDYGMMAELVRRRLVKGGLPDLFLVDGGKGHLMVVQKLLGARPNADGPELAAIAKEREGEAGDKIFIPGRKNPLNLKPGDPELHFLMTIRDQVHRRAVGFLRQLKKGKMSESILDFIPGIGPKRKKALLRHFRDMKAISGANLDDFLKIPGLNKELALNILDFFKNLRDND
jgi:excinuclease ABC subunit C